MPELGAYFLHISALNTKGQSALRSLLSPTTREAINDIE